MRRFRSFPYIGGFTIVVLVVAVISLVLFMLYFRPESTEMEGELTTVQAERDARKELGNTTSELATTTSELATAKGEITRLGTENTRLGKENTRLGKENTRLTELAEVNGGFAQAIIDTRAQALRQAREATEWQVEMLREALIFALNPLWIDMQEGETLGFPLDSGNVLVLEIRDGRPEIAFLLPPKR